MTLSARFQRLGDLAAGTLVIYRPELASEAVSGNHAADAQRARIPLRLEEQNVLVNFLERSDGLTSERSDELATIVAGALGLDAGDPAADPTDSVKQLASGFRGG